MTVVRAPERPALSQRDQAVGVFFGLWMIVGLFLDGWAHDNNRPESFFTPWHGVLYSGFAGAAATALWVAARDRGDGELLRLPQGHGLTLAALGVFAAGAVGDLLWHEILGIEVGVEALLSPTHLTLLASGIVALSAPLRAAWATTPRAPESLRAFLPPVLSLALLTALVAFFLLYLSPFVNDAASQTFVRAPTAPHDHPASDPRELRQLLGVGSILTTSVLLAVPAHLLLRRWQPPRGSFTLLFGLVVTLFIALDEFRQLPLVLAGIAAGVAADAVATRWPAATGAAGVTVLWTAYFGIYQVAEGGVGWTAELWTGSVFLSALLASAIGLLAPVPGEAAQPR